MPLLVILAGFVLAMAVLIIKLQEIQLRQKQRIIEGQDEIIAKQRQLIEEKMTSVVEQALTPKKKRGRHERTFSPSTAPIVDVVGSDPPDKRSLF